MKKFIAALSRFKSQAGFTMIELLIVISILGILAVAVLSAINPIEQINRGRDTGSRSDAEQLLSAIDRFHAFQGYYPWRTSPSDTSNGGSNALAWTKLDSTGWNTWADSTTCTVLEKLSSSAPSGADLCTTHADELKSSFVTRLIGTGYNSLFVYNRGNVGDSTYVCFSPQSKAFSTEAINRLDTDGDGVVDAAPADYPTDAYGNTTDCGDAGYCVCLP